MTTQQISVAATQLRKAWEADKFVQKAPPGRSSQLRRLLEAARAKRRATILVA